MKLSLAVLAAAMLVAGNLVTVSPARAEFSVSKPAAGKPKPKKAKPKPRPSRTSGSSKLAGTQPDAKKPAGYNPVDVMNALQSIGLGPVLIVNPDTSQTIRVADGLRSNIGPWSAQLTECGTADRCRQLVFSYIWEVSNDANVCASWNYYITKDMNHANGMPLCMPIGSSGRRLQVWLTSEQVPYAGIDRITPEEAKNRVSSMVNIWVTYIQRLPEARNIARDRCPKKGKKCW